MGTFDYARNRVISGICEWCGTRASECPHYKDRPQPMDDLKKLEHPAFMPKVARFEPVMPLTPDEIAPSLADALKAKLAHDDRVKAEEREKAAAEKPRGRPPLPRDPETGEIVRV